MSEEAKGCEILKHLPRPAADPRQTSTGALRLVPRELLLFHFEGEKEKNPVVPDGRWGFVGCRHLQLIQKHPTGAMGTLGCLVKGSSRLLPLLHLAHQQKLWCCKELHFFFFF